MNAMVEVKRKPSDLECIIYMFQFVYIRESKRKHLTFSRKDVTSFFMYFMHLICC